MPMKKIASVLLTAFLLIPQLLPINANAAGDSLITSLVHIAAREDFAFRSNLSNSGAGESAPITQDYYLSKYKVTNAQYKTFLDETSRKAPRYWTNGTYPKGKADHPVLNVSYSDATAYCDWLCAKYNDWTFRLPTEAEWENAAMGTYYGNTKVKYPGKAAPSYDAATCTITTGFNYNGVIAAKLFRDHGSDYVVDYIKGDYAGTSETLGECIQISATGGVSNWANHSGSAAKGYFLQTDLYATISADGGYTTPVGSYSPNTLGLYDMAGNCWDLTSSVIVAANGLEAGVSCYAVRGGSWYATARSCTFSYRGEGRKDSPSSTVGFRVAADYHPASCEHSYSSWTAVGDRHQKICSACKHIQTAAHAWDSGTVEQRADCLSGGQIKYTCTACLAVKTEKTDKSGEHQYGSWSKRDDNTHSRACTVCGHTASDTHSWDQGIVNKQANCLEPGQITYTCTVCLGTKTEPISKQDTHTYDHSCETDCNLCGDRRDTVHTYEDQWTADDICHWYACTGCGAEAEKAAHVLSADTAVCTVCEYAIASGNNTLSASTPEAEAPNNFHILWIPVALLPVVIAVIAVILRKKQHQDRP